MEFAYRGTSATSDGDIEKTGEKLASYREHLEKVARDKGYAYLESSIFLPCDESLRNEVKILGDRLHTEKLKYVFLVGIGGSNLGARALYEAFYLFSDKYTDRSPKTYFLDTINTRMTDKLISFVESRIKHIDEVLVVIVTKSGNTTETLVNVELLSDVLEKKFGEAIYNRFVAITEDDSSLSSVARTKNIPVLAIPKKVGGRYSVFSPVGLFPLYVSGVWDVEKLHKKAKDMQERCLLQDPQENPALTSAAIMYDHIRKGAQVHDLFCFGEELASVGKWHRQLMAESLGKEEDIEGGKVCTGITPTVSIGSTDLHSTAQLVLAGPNNRVTTFVKLVRQEDQIIPKNRTFSEIKGLSGKSAQDILDAIYGGTKKAYVKKNRPFMEIVLEDLFDIAAFMQFKMIETMYLGKLLNINPFDQPQVELYKEETRKLLS